MFSADDLFCVPSSRMTYPAETEVPATRLKEVLEQVDLGYLVDRPGVLTEEINWEETLSLGEKQRLAIA